MPCQRWPDSHAAGHAARAVCYTRLPRKSPPLVFSRSYSGRAREWTLTRPPMNRSGAMHAVHEAGVTALGRFEMDLGELSLIHAGHC